ncbi:MAG: hypothetical protein RL038_985 [Actinomycetota bacterium]
MAFTERVLEMRAGFILSEVKASLSRNLTLTFASIITVAVSLSLFGASLLVRAQVNEMKDFWYDRVEVSIFLCGDISDQPSCASGAITDTERANIRQDLEDLAPLVAKVYYESQAEALERFKEQFAGSPLAETATEEQMPESFRVKLSDPTKYNIVAAAFRDRPGIEDVRDQRQALEKLFQALNGLQNLALSISLAMLVVTTLLISNTMRVAAFSRKRETSIMRLVGASNWSIQLPFVLEAGIASLAGTALAFGGLALTKFYLIDQSLAETYTFTNFIGWDAVFAVLVPMLVVGVGLAVLAAVVTLRKYLKV